MEVLILILFLTQWTIVNMHEIKTSQHMKNWMKTLYKLKFKKKYFPQKCSLTVLSSMPPHPRWGNRKWKSVWKKRLWQNSSESWWSKWWERWSVFGALPGALHPNAGKDNTSQLYHHHIKPNSPSSFLPLNQLVWRETSWLTLALAPPSISSSLLVNPSRRSLLLTTLIRTCGS